MSRVDRTLVEDLFADGHIQVCCSCVLSEQLEGVLFGRKLTASSPSANVASSSVLLSSQSPGLHCCMFPGNSARLVRFLQAQLLVDTAHQDTP
jgi:hypothetical protein